MEEFHKRLRKFIRAKGLRHEDISVATGISKSTISSYVAGNRSPSVGNLVLMAEYLDVSTDCLLGRSDKYPQWYEDMAREAFHSIEELIDPRAFREWMRTGVR